MSSELFELSKKIEDVLVEKNPRNMQMAQQALEAGYYLRAAQTIKDNKGVVFIGTGFPVDTTFETDGPVGAIHLYDSLEKLGYQPMLVCADPLYSVFTGQYRTIELPLGRPQPQYIVKGHLSQYNPSLIISIERPGKTADGQYRNMFGKDISENCGQFDDYVELATCPTIAIGDGGNEIGMGNITEQLKSLDISLSVTKCDELLVADVSNWAAYGITALLGLLSDQCLLTTAEPLAILSWLSENGSVDGVTKENTLTEDSLDYQHGEQLIKSLINLCEPYWNKQ